ncbi:Protein obstructor-E [Gryllus bimaculatus]|nr:Protein obstructor-E [Gryllus bimaculatus]
MNTFLLFIFLSVCNVRTGMVDEDIRAPIDGWPTCELGGRYDLVHHEYCDRYFTCHHGESYLRQCEDGLGFVPFSGCKLLHLVNCSGREKLQAAKDSGDCPRLYGIHAHPKGCSYYLQCYNGTASTQSCANDLIFDTDKKICRPPRPLERQTCIIPSNSQPSEFHCPVENLFPFGDHSRHPHPVNCAFFIMCLRDGSQKIGSCEPGKAFSIISQNCVPVEKISNCKL